MFKISSLLLLLGILSTGLSYLISGPAYCTANDLKTTCPTSTPVLSITSTGGLSKFTTICAACNKNVIQSYFLNSCTASQRTTVCANSKISVCGLGSTGLKNYANDCAACATSTKISQYFYGACPSPPSSSAKTPASTTATTAATTTAKPATTTTATTTPVNPPVTTTPSTTSSSSSSTVKPTTPATSTTKANQYMDVLPGVDDDFIITPSNDDPSSPSIDSYGLPLKKN